MNWKIDDIRYTDAEITFLESKVLASKLRLLHVPTGIKKNNLTKTNLGKNSLTIMSIQIFKIHLHKKKQNKNKTLHLIKIMIVLTAYR